MSEPECRASAARAIAFVIIKPFLTLLLAPALLARFATLLAAVSASEMQLWVPHVAAAVLTTHLSLLQEHPGPVLEAGKEQKVSVSRR